MESCVDFLLLTHERELSKKSNTGQLVLDCLGAKALRVVWVRRQPDFRVLNLARLESTCLLYPLCGEVMALNDYLALNEASHEKCFRDLGSDVTMNTENPELNALQRFKTFILIDSTWQQARKIYNQSPYLKSIKKIALPSLNQSMYKLRRNQLSSGLCTVECVIAVLKLYNEMVLADRLEAKFIEFNQI